MNIGILEPESFSLKAIQELEKIGNVTCFKKDLENFIVDKDVLFIRLNYFIGEDFLKKAPNLKFICTPTTGLNHIDQEIVNKRQIVVLSLKGETGFLEKIRATPEHTFGLAIALLRNYKTAFLNATNSEWDRKKFFGEELFANNIGIIGFGRVGKLIAKYCDAFGANIYFYDIDEKVEPAYNAQKTCSVAELIAKSNIIFLAASYQEAQVPVMGDKEIDLMKDKYFINTARGELVDEVYLLKAINSNHFKGVAIDVIENETRLNRLNEFLSLTNRHNLIITPHIGGASYSSLNRTEEFIVEKLKKTLERTL